MVDKEAALLGPVFAFCGCDSRFPLLEESSTEVARPASKLWPSHCWERVIITNIFKRISETRIKDHHLPSDMRVQLLRTTTGFVPTKILQNSQD